MLWAIFILLGMILDSSIAMMDKGAQLTDLSYRKTVVYAMIYTAVTFVIFSCGYGIARILDPYAFTVRFQTFLSVAAVMCIGVLITTKAFTRQSVEEKADRQFCSPALMKMAAVTNIDTFVVGACTALYGLPYILSGTSLAVFSFVSVIVSLRIGYSIGSGYQKLIGIIGGILIIIFAVYLGFIGHLMG